MAKAAKHISPLICRVVIMTDLMKIPWSLPSLNLKMSQSKYHLLQELNLLYVAFDMPPLSALKILIILPQKEIPQIKIEVKIYDGELPISTPCLCV